MLDNAAKWKNEEKENEVVKKLVPKVPPHVLSLAAHFALSSAGVCTSEVGESWWQ